MEDIVKYVRQGETIQVRLWMDNIDNDLNQGDEHRFTLLHWACREGKTNIVELLIQRGAKANLTNMGDDTPLHLAAAHNHVDCVRLLLRLHMNQQQSIDVNASNEHGNTPLHYACFWNYIELANELIVNGAFILQENRNSQTPVELLRNEADKLKLLQCAEKTNQNVTERLPFRDSSWFGTKSRAKDLSTLARLQSTLPTPAVVADGSTFSNTNSGVPIEHIRFIGDQPLFSCAAEAVNQLVAREGRFSRCKEVWRAQYAGQDVVVKKLKLKEYSIRISRDFAEETTRLRIFNHVNIHPVIVTVNSPPCLWLISYYTPHGSLFDVLHGGDETILMDLRQTCRFALDICSAMEFLHNPELKVPNFRLNSKHILVDEDFVAKLDMADCKFSFYEKAQDYNPGWMAPEALTKKPGEINVQAADVWSFGVVLYELERREIPFCEHLDNPMALGLKIATTNLRLRLGEQPGCSRQMTRLVQLCLREEPGKRPRFDMLLPVLQKMLEATAAPQQTALNA